MNALTTTQVAAILQISRPRVIALIRSGRLRAVKFGNAWAIDERDLNSVKVRTAGYPKGKPRK